MWGTTVTTMVDTITLGGRLATLRKARGLSTRTLAASVGMAHSTYERREIDADNMTMREAAKLASFYGLSISELVLPADAEATAGAVAA